MILLSFLFGVAVVLVATLYCFVAGRRLWRQAKTTGRAFSAEMALFEERSARTERLFGEAEHSQADLQAALERLRVSRARLDVLREAVAQAQQRTRWLRAFLPAR